MKDDIKKYYDAIIECMVVYGGLSPEDAVSALIASPIYKLLLSNENTDVGILDHETPYYWAMHIIYYKVKPDWHQDQNLWPPPKEYLDKLNKH